MIKSFGSDVVHDESLNKFINSIGDSYKHFEESQELLQHAMVLSNEELFETNKRLIEESRLHNLILNSLKESILEISPVHIDLDNDLLKIVDILKEEIVKRKAVEKELVTAREIAENSLKTRETFFANMSHEIRTPMNGIIGMTRLLAETNLDEEQSKFQNVILNSAEDLVVIINDILDITKISSGNLMLESLDCCICELLDDMIKMMRLKAEEKGIYLRMLCYEKKIKAHKVDPTRLKQVLINLLSNAIKFTEKGGVTLSVELVDSKDQVDSIKFKIVDSGIGIAADKVDAVFSSFVQEDESTNRRYGGTGLGLAISKQLVEAFGGELFVESTKNEGTTFHFTLDLPHGELKEKVVYSEEEKDLKSANILIVEDNEINTMVATAVLEKWNCNIHAVENGKKAVELEDLEKFNVILMDMQMPVMDGIEATQYIRNKLKLTIPIIGFTANALLGERENCLNVGMDEYISKPFMPDDLYNKIVSLIRA